MSPCHRARLVGGGSSAKPGVGPAPKLCSLVVTGGPHGTLTPMESCAAPNAQRRSGKESRAN